MTFLLDIYNGCMIQELTSMVIATFVTYMDRDS
jgi:hypothetical protein